MANCSMGRVKILSLAIVLVLAVVYIQNVEGYRPPQSFFDRILSGASAGCAGKSFYKYADFVQAANAFSAFANTGSLAMRKREVAAFFANVAHETGSLCYIREINRGTYCQSSTKYPCANGVKYYGRGPLQLTWNYNYGAAGDYFNLGLLKNPNIVATNGVVSWKTAVWFWMVNSRCHNAITSGHGFGQTIRYINGGECNGGNSAAVTDRVNYYKKFCSWLGVDPGSNLRC